MRRVPTPRNRCRGLTAVEFAICATATFILLFGVLEVSRMVYARTMLEEGVRRGARMAAVCPINDPRIARSVMFAPGGGTSPILPRLTTGNVQIQYLNLAGGVLGTPAATPQLIEFVSVSIQNFSMQLIIPFVNPTFAPTAIRSTLPRESLGLIAGANVAC